MRPAKILAKFVANIVMATMMAMGWMAVAMAQQTAPKEPIAPKGAAAAKEAAAKEVPAAAEKHDAVLEAASEEIGNALFLRCLCAENNLAFDAEGRLQGGDRGKTTDWTLAGMNVLKVERRPATGQAPEEIEMEGVRVAMRYAPDRHEFDRKPQNGEKMKILIADAGDVKRFQRALRAIFAVGIDVPLQRSMPEYWQHYFDLGRAWDKDEVTGQAVVTPGVAPGNPGTAVTEAEVTHRAQASYTDAAGRDKVQGTVAVRMVVDSTGEARRIAIAQPLGYGLDERAAEATAKMRFSPATMGGKPVASNVLLRQEFVVVAAR